ncbi:MAG: right-handed parallel beta-helix repeat-containing protein, partial [Waterburya sp.]
MTTYNVTNSNDNGAGSLREALTLANANEGADTIVLMSDVTLSSAIAITDDVTIEGNKHLVTQTGTDRLFTIDDGNAEQDSQVNLSELRLTGGAPVETGGAIYSVENLAIADSELFGNATTKRGGAVYQEGASLDITNSYIHDNAIADGTTSAGGGVYIREGNLTVDNSKFERNQALGSGGITVFTGATAKITNSQFSYNNGSAIYVGEAEL